MREKTTSEETTLNCIVSKGEVRRRRVEVGLCPSPEAESMEVNSRGESRAEKGNWQAMRLKQ